MRGGHFGLPLTSKPDFRGIFGRSVADLIHNVFLITFGIDFKPIFNPNLDPKIHQNRSNLDAKMLPISASIFIWCLIDCWSPFQVPVTLQLLIFNFLLVFEWFLRNWLTEINIDFGSDFAPNLGPSWLPKSIKNQQKNNQRSHQIFIWFLHRFCMDVLAFWSPSCPQFGPNLAPRTAQERPKRRLGGPLVASGGRLGANNPPRAAQEPTLWAQDRFF